jgi:hypothetical protein
MGKPCRSKPLAVFCSRVGRASPRAKHRAPGHQGFIAKGLRLVFNGKKMMADAMDQGLANMKSVVEGASKA